MPGWAQRTAPISGIRISTWRRAGWIIRASRRRLRGASRSGPRQSTRSRPCWRRANYHATRPTRASCFSLGRDGDGCESKPARSSPALWAAIVGCDLRTFGLGRQSGCVALATSTGSGSGTDRLFHRHRLAFRSAVEDQLLLVADLLDLDLDQALAGEFALQELLGERVFDGRFDRPPQRPGAEIGVRALLDQELLGFVGELERDALFQQPLAGFSQFQIDHAL